MPFKSKAQQRWMFATRPKMAERWAEHTKDFKTLPDKVGATPKEGTDLMNTLSGFAKQAADAQLVEKLAHDTQITPTLVRHLAARVNMSPAAFVKAAYADPAAYTIFLKLATGVVKPEQMTKGAMAGAGLVGKLINAMKSGAQGAANFGKGVAGKTGPATTTGSIPFRTGQAINTGAKGLNNQANRSLNAVGVTRPEAQRVGKIAGGTAAVGGTAGVANNAMKSPPASAPEQPGQHEATVNGQIGGAEAAGMNPAAQAGAAAPAQTNGPAANPQQPPSGGLGTAGKALIAGGGAAIGALGVGAAMRKRKQQKQVTAADLAKDVMRHAIVKKAAELHRKVAADQFVRGMDKVASFMPLEKQAMLRKVQAAVAEGKPLSHAIKIAYPHLNGEQRGILATKLVKVACQVKQASPGGPLFKKTSTRQETSVKMKDGAVGKMKAMSN